MVILIIAIILALVIATGVVWVLVAQKREKAGMSVETIYRRLYIFGTILVTFSIVSMAVFFILQIYFFIGLPLFAVGLIFLIIGLANRDKWRK